ncbi:MAG: NAD(P)-dependent alcohol dehydrogenase [Hyphomonas sp.]|uniref:NAD(P)-dependent alcohol dehydrogenase n=1 Tax=Hyphomonas sp. TaxID=87 RepID=UPI001837E3F0|nr:NAD(P)-dependent alcohol dehydrogenase [Hyphomonas sp.]MBA3067446.1 NAD(P)-dependent alcohol dehydrogenase [Hyphomonas sp.]MBU3920699.1 NAD(P)-dependent alcohol dehydrogenase [Alphaproteobacteria bacterium]MBU4061002.1 NAD(P)-dependent alcohol dehydrogenase [Alphaproteobacteria bacterium]MBU4165858.1 NAD(P)-dependent alcohol dehydrogenase [Alphaproteobacteria bacterium]
MLAVTCRRYGPPEVLKIEEVARPTPKDDEVLVRVRASSVTSGDVRMRAFTGAGIFWLPMRLLFGVLRPWNPITGMEFVGTIADVGKGATAFRVGDVVFGMKIGGANAEFLAVREAGAIAPKPDRLNFEEAAVVPFGALSALEFLRDFVQIKPGQKILIHGASGAVGVFAVQLAKHFGAHVTGVCSTANAELVTSLGADQVIDYSKTDFTRGPGIYDAILDTVGGTSFSRSKRVLAPYGRHVFVVQTLTQLLQALWTSMRRGKRVIVGFSGGDSKEDLLLIKGLIETGRIRPVLDRTYRLPDIVDAHRYVDTGRKRGGVAISIGAAP